MTNYEFTVEMNEQFSLCEGRGIFSVKWGCGKKRAYIITRDYKIDKIVYEETVKQSLNLNYQILSIPKSVFQEAEERYKQKQKEIAEKEAFDRKQSELAEKYNYKLTKIR